MATPEEIEILAQALHAERSRVEAGAHGQGVVPWQDLGETFKVSLRRMAQDRFKGFSPRSADLERIANLAGTDLEGGILPPAVGEIDRTPNNWWKNG